MGIEKADNLPSSDTLLSPLESNSPMVRVLSELVSLRDSKTISVDTKSWERIVSRLVTNLITPNGWDIGALLLKLEAVTIMDLRKMKFINKPSAHRIMNIFEECGLVSIMGQVTAPYTGSLGGRRPRIWGLVGVHPDRVKEAQIRYAGYRQGEKQAKTEARIEAEAIKEAKIEAYITQTIQILGVPPEKFGKIYQVMREVGVPVPNQAQVKERIVSWMQDYEGS